MGQIDLFYDLFLHLFDLFWPRNMTVSQITSKFSTEISPFYAHRCFWVTTSSSLQMGYIDLFYDLFLYLFDLFWTKNITISQINSQVFDAKSSFKAHRCFWVIFTSSSQMGHFVIFYGTLFTYLVYFSNYTGPTLPSTRVWYMHYLPLLHTPSTYNPYILCSGN